MQLPLITDPKGDGKNVRVDEDLAILKIKDWNVNCWEKGRMEKTSEEGLSRKKGCHANVDDETLEQRFQNFVAS
ncbi:hypothetical protein TNCT_188551 [Trichonephila clavata]|uniref:Uncharacterized protein n=1 Tax=Trichonephila clavata TaxID=2740835 RepID=A0A8X6I842_TRICU|nr:hypothetical protein TNCT_188551 [Trichonephila clavata]